MEQTLGAKYAEQFVTQKDTESIEVVQVVGSFTIGQSEKC